MNDALLFTPPTLDIEIVRGDTWRWEFEVTDEAGTVIPWVSARLHVRRAFDETDGLPVLEASSANGKITRNATTNVGTVHLTASDTNALEPMRGYYDLQVTYANGDVFTEIAGKTRIHRDVTRA